MKRFTETGKWNDPWFRRLTPGAKLLWHWIVDHCDAAGVIDIDLELASFQIGVPISPDTLSEIGQRALKLPCGKLHIPRFVEFQVGVPSEECKAHRPIFQSWEKHGIKGYPKGIETVSDTVQDKEKEKEKDKEGVQRGGPKTKKSQPVDEAWLAGLVADYPHLNVQLELTKMRRWCETKRKQPTRARFVNWLNHAEAPLSGADPPALTPAQLDAKRRLAVMMRRNPDDSWSREETSALLDIGTIAPADLQRLEWFYGLRLPENNDAHRRSSLLAVLMNFRGELDKARNFKEPSLF